MAAPDAQSVEKPSQLKAKEIVRVSSVCIKSLAEFALASAKKIGIIFSGGVYVGENTARLANVRRVRPSCAAASRSPFKREPSETGLV